MKSLDLSTEAKRRLAALTARPRGHRIGVLGLGVSGKAMALYFAHRGARVLGVDTRSEARDAALEAAGVQLALGPVGADAFADCEGLAISPGADPRQPAVQAVLAADKPVFGELELVSPLPARTIAITGTNGKSTTTALAGALVEGTGVQAFVGGNLGDPIAGWLDGEPRTDVAILELSSFQLETVCRFAPEVGVVLNLTPDHLDRYDSVEAYAAAKERLVAAVPSTGTVVLN
ncbi:MAG TPA: Mur ligase family protein, partial [Myxococcota bacterium]|nr:Mur ligase family protein [Myxococcota bacterium]